MYKPSTDDNMLQEYYSLQSITGRTRPVENHMWQLVFSLFYFYYYYYFVCQYATSLSIDSFGNITHRTYSGTDISLAKDVVVLARLAITLLAARRPLGLLILCYSFTLGLFGHSPDKHSFSQQPNLFVNPDSLLPLL